MKKWIVRAGWAVVFCALITLGYLGFDRDPVHADGTSRFGAVVVSGTMNAQLSNANTQDKLPLALTEVFMSFFVAPTLYMLQKVQMKERVLPAPLR